MTIRAEPTVVADPADAKINALAEALFARRWGEQQGARRRWALVLSALVLALKPGVKLHNVLGAAPFDAGDLDLVDTLNTLATLGFFARRSRCKAGDVDKRLLPCLFRPAAAEDSPWAILGPSSDGGLRIYDTASESIEIVAADDRRLRRAGECWFFKRFDEHAQSVSKFVREGSGYSWFRALLGRFSGVFVQVLAAGFVLNLVALSIPLFIMLVYDSVIFSGAGELLPGLAIGAGLAIGLELMLRTVRSHGLSWLAARLDYVVGVKIFAHLLDLEPKDVERASVPAQIARIKTFEAVRDFFCGGAFLSFMEIPFVALTLAVIAAMAGPLVIAPLAFAAAYVILFHVVRERVKVAIRAAAKASSARQRFAMELFEKHEAIRLCGLSDLWADKFRQLSGRDGLAQFRLSQLGFAGEIGSHTLTVTAGVVTVAAGAHLFWSGAITSGGLVATMILVWRSLSPLHNLCTMIPRLEQLRHSVLQVNALIELDSEASAQGRASIPSIRGAISVRGVRLRYGEKDDPALDEADLEAKPGELVAITGGSGSGKSTLLKVVQALYRPEAGAVLIDGFDLRQLDPLELRRQIGYAPQHPDFFPGTVLENLRLGNPLASAEDARRALEAIDGWADVAALPHGLDTPIAARGAAAAAPSLTPKLALARLLLHDGRILLIDELPNAVMSGPAGARLRSLLTGWKRRKTVLVVTQREDVMALADQVVTLSRHGRARRQTQPTSAIGARKAAA